MTPAQFLAATGMALRPGLAQQSVDLLAPGALYGERINVVDMRFAKVLRFGRTRLNVGMDLYNLLNANAPTALRDRVRPGHQRRALDAADGRSQPAGGTVQRAVGLLIESAQPRPAIQPVCLMCIPVRQSVRRRGVEGETFRQPS